MAKYRDKTTGELKEMYVAPGGDTLPIGAQVDIPIEAEIPYGYKQIGTSLTSRQILWTNPSPTATFAPKNISLLNDDYDILEIFYSSNNTNTDAYFQKFKKGQSVDLTYFGGSSKTLRNRLAMYVNNTSYDFGEGKAYSALNTTTYATNNDFVIPQQIVGYKLTKRIEKTQNLAGLVATTQNDLTPSNVNTLDVDTILDNFQLKSEIQPVPTADLITLNTGFSILDNTIFKDNNHYFGYITIGKNAKFTGTQETVGILKKGTVKSINFYGISGATTDGRWDIPTKFAYLYIQTDGTILLKGATTDAYVKCYIDFVANN